MGIEISSVNRIEPVRKIEGSSQDDKIKRLKAEIERIKQNKILSEDEKNRRIKNLEKQIKNIQMQKTH